MNIIKFTEKYQLYINNIYHICKMYQKSEEETEYVIKRVFTKFYYNPQSFRNKSDECKWLLVTTERFCKKRWNHSMNDSMVPFYMHCYLDYHISGISKLLKISEEEIKNYLKEAKTSCSNIFNEEITSCTNVTEIKEMFQKLRMSDTKKEQLLNDILLQINGVPDGQNKVKKHFYAILYRYQKPIKIITIIAILVLVYSAYVRIIDYRAEKKEQMGRIEQIEYVFSDEVNTIIEEQLKEDGQEIRVDDYTITLKKSLYDKETKQGKLLFWIKRDEHNMMNEEVTGSAMIFGKEGRFRLTYLHNGEVAEKVRVQVEKHKSVVYIYLDFSFAGIETFDDAIYLEDVKQKKELNELDGENEENALRGVVGKFVLKENVSE